MDEMDEWMKKLDAILDKYGIVENRDAIKDDIYHDIIVEVWCDGRQTGRDTYWKWDD
jgi:hypothetical protein